MIQNVKKSHTNYRPIAPIISGAYQYMFSNSPNLLERDT